MEPQNQNLPAQQGTAPVSQFTLQRKQASDLLEKYKSAIEQALPSFLTPERMIRVALTAMSKTPDLLQCTQASVISCVLTCAQLGLLPDGILGEAYLIPFNNTKANRKDCTVIVGYRGLCALAMRSGEVASIAARAVFEGDFFEYEFGLDEFCKHKPAGGTDPNKITHFYAVVKFKSGGRNFIVMTRGEVEAVRNDSANYKFAKDKSNTVWGKHFQEMGQKTVVRRLMKMVPLSPEINRAVGLDEAADLGKQNVKVDFMDFPDMPTEDIAHEIVQDDEADKADKLEEKKATDKGKGAQAVQATIDKINK